MRLHPSALTVLRLLNEVNHEAFVAGGAVRDLLMGLDPKDWDVATSATPTEVVGLFTSKGFKVVPTGLQHGTVTVVVHGEPVEVTTFRVDTETDGRHAVVEFTTDSKRDAARRDLTVNSMFMDVDGNVVDHFGGRADLEARVVRFVGNPHDRVQEDFLRVLRFFRFAGKLGVVPDDEETLAVVRANVEGLKGLSGERVWSELSKLVMFDTAPSLLAVMQDMGVLEALGFPEWFDTHAVLLVHPDADPMTKFALGLSANRDSGQVTTAVQRLLSKWKVSKQERELLEFLTATDTRTWVNDVMSDCEDMVSMFKMVAVERGKELATQLLMMGRCQNRLSEFESWDVPVFPVSGADLMAVGVPAGVGMGKHLKSLKMVWALSMFTESKESLLELVKQSSK